MSADTLKELLEDWPVLGIVCVVVVVLILEECVFALVATEDKPCLAVAEDFGEEIDVVVEDPACAVLACVKVDKPVKFEIPEDECVEVVRGVVDMLVNKTCDVSEDGKTADVFEDAVECLPALIDPVGPAALFVPLLSVVTVVVEVTLVVEVVTALVVVVDCIVFVVAEVGLLDVDGAVELGGGEEVSTATEVVSGVAVVSELDTTVNVAGNAVVEEKQHTTHMCNKLSFIQSSKMLIFTGKAPKNPD